MTVYDWVCNDCKVVWEQDHPLGQAPKETECPECGESRGRNWASVTNFEMKGACYTNISRMRKRLHNGMEKDEADKFLNSSIERSTAAINKGGWQHYAKYEPNYEQMVKNGRATVRSDKEKTKAIENSMNLTRAVYNDHGRDISDSLKMKPQ